MVGVSKRKDYIGKVGGLGVVRGLLIVFYIYLKVFVRY